jgi:hypothetical protein
MEVIAGVPRHEPSRAQGLQDLVELYGLADFELRAGELGFGDRAELPPVSQEDPESSGRLAGSPGRPGVIQGDSSGLLGRPGVFFVAVFGLPGRPGVIRGDSSGLQDDPESFFSGFFLSQEDPESSGETPRVSRMTRSHFTTGRW